jgi:hypothetical protein
LADRPLPTRSHAAQLLLERGMEHELLLRVETSSTMVLPLALWREEVYRAHESRVEAGQGLLGGIALCLLLYSLAQWLVLRDNAYLYYALNVFGLALFFVNQFGLGAEHLWPGSPWAMEKASPASVLLGLIGGILFIDRVLEVRQLYPRASRLLRACALLSAVTIGLFLTGVIDYPQAHVMTTLLGPVPMLVGVPVAWVRARQGDRSALFIFLGWGLYSIGVGVMAAFLRGQVDVNFWTQHSLQFATLAEMAMWMLVLGLRNVSIRQAAEQARRERDRMSSLASTDPLTGLLNRRGLQAALARRLDQVSPQRLSAVYVMDLDGFKPVNDLLGHDAGDELLIAAAARLLHPGIELDDRQQHRQHDQHHHAAHHHDQQRLQDGGQPPSRGAAPRPTAAPRRGPASAAAGRSVRPGGRTSPAGPGSASCRPARWPAARLRAPAPARPARRRAWRGCPGSRPRPAAPSGWARRHRPAWPACRRSAPRCSRGQRPTSGSAAGGVAAFAEGLVAARQPRAVLPAAASSSHRPAPAAHEALMRQHGHRQEGQRALGAGEHRLATCGTT